MSQQSIEAGGDEAADVAEDLPGAIEAVPVHIPHHVNVQSQAADFGAYMTYTTPAGADTARPILPFDSFRHKAVILTSAPGAPVNGSGVWIGTQAQVQASPPVGGFIPVGANLPVENNQAMWMVGDGTSSVRVTVAVERWDSGT